MSLARAALQYLGVRAKNPPNLITAVRDPTGSDKAYVIGTLWLNKSTPAVFMWSGATWVDLTAGGGGGVDGPVTSVVGDIALWDNTSGTLLSDSGVTLPVTVPHGGLGAVTLTSHGLLLGHGTANVTALAPNSTAGALVASQGPNADPAYLIPTAGDGLTLTTDGTTLEYALTTSPAPYFQTVAIKSASYTLVSTDYYIGVDTTAGSFTMTLPASPTTGQQFVIKDSGGIATSSNIAVAGNGKNIDGSTSYTISNNYGSISLIYNGIEWSIL